MLVEVATIASVLALLSGILAIGGGAHWHFTNKDILRGRQNALLYVWVTFSSIFSLAHVSALVSYGLEHSWAYRDYDTSRWMSIHTGIALLLMTAHLYILSTLRRQGEAELYLWGTHND